MENLRISWEEIKTSYNQEWVELVDYDWPEEHASPSTGAVRTHGANKKEFHLQCRREPVPSDSAILFVGRPPIPDGVVLSPSLVRVTSCEK